MKNKTGKKSFVISTARRSFLNAAIVITSLVSLGVIGNAAAEKATGSASLTTEATSVATVTSRSAQYENGSTIPTALQFGVQLDVSRGGDVETVVFNRETEEIHGRLAFAIADLDSVPKSRAQAASLLEILNLEVVDYAAASLPRADSATREQLSNSLKKVKLPVSKSQSKEERAAVSNFFKIRDLFLSAISVSAQVAAAPVTKDTVAPIASANAHDGKAATGPGLTNGGERNSVANLKSFLRKGQELFDVVASHMTYAEKAQFLPDIFRDLGDAQTLVRGGRSAADIYTALRKLAASVAASESKLAEFVSTPEFSTTGPELREWVHALARTTSTVSTFELRRPVVVETPSKAPVRTVPHASLRGAIVLREVPTLAKGYLVFIQNGHVDVKSDAKVEVAFEQQLTQANAAADVAIAAVASYSGDPVFMPNGIRQALTDLVKKLRVFDKDLNRLRKAAETQNQAMDYSIWLKRLEIETSGSTAGFGD